MKKRILVIDDEPTVGMLLQFNLQQKGFEVYIADNASDGMRVAQDTVIDLFVLDISMPGTNGIEICKLLRENPRYATTPIVMISSKSDEETINASKKAGATHYVTKPFVFKEFAEQIESYIK